MTERSRGKEDIIEPVGPLSDQRPVTTTMQRRARPATTLIVAGTGLFAALLFVVLVLPRWVADETAEPAVTPQPQATVDPLADVDPELLAALREEAEALLTQVVVQEGELAPLQPEVWAAVAWQQYKQAALDGDDSFLEKDYAQAARGYQLALQLGEALGARSDEVLKQALIAGDEALRAGDATAATEHYTLAQRINGDSAEILDGLARAERLPEVLAAMSRGSVADEAGDVEAAIEGYEAALAVDPKWEPARSGLNSARGRLAAYRFERAMSTGLARLEEQDFSAAAAAFERALAIRPNAQGALDGLQRVDQGRRLNRINLARIRGTAFEKQERWAEAAEQYTAALELDDTLVFAQEGLERANARADLGEKIALLVARPSRLFEPAVLADAVRLVDRGRAALPPKSALDDQLDKLANYIAQASTPIDVTLVSDGLTEVTLYRVGRLEPFERQRLALRPGDYVAVGSRNGYRDVRANFKLRPGRIPEPVVVACTDPI